MSELWKETEKEVVTVHATGSGALAQSLVSAANGYQLLDVRLKVGVAAGTAENFTITLDANAGSGYDVNIVTEAMAGVTSELVLDINMFFEAGDAILFAWTNTDARTWGLSYRYRRFRI
jgi:hypothetical protein